MRIQIEGPTIDYWMCRLQSAGLCEIGGVLFGEQLSEGYFRVVGAKQQAVTFGTRNRFCRNGVEARETISFSHHRYGGDPERFNYLGEWHSHPNTSVVPSDIDEQTMTQLVVEQAGAVNFLVLIIVRISKLESLELGAQAYLTSGHVLPCEVDFETTNLDRYD